MYKIAVVGSHGVGKTTLCSTLSTYLRSKGKTVEQVGEVVRDCPYPINDKMEYRACEWITLTQILRERFAERNNPDFVICDRASTDPSIYFQLAAKCKAITVLDSNLWGALWDKVSCHVATYDRFVYLVPGTELPEPDGFRDTNVRFRGKVDEAFGAVFGEEGCEHGQIGSLVIDKSVTIPAFRVFKEPEDLCFELLCDFI